MSVSPNKSELPKSGLTWITLIASTAGLLVLSGWALLNPSVLFQQIPESSRNALTNQSQSDSKLADNGAEDNGAEDIGAEDSEVEDNEIEDNEAGLSAIEMGVVELIPEQATGLTTDKSKDWSADEKSEALKTEDNFTAVTQMEEAAVANASAEQSTEQSTEKNKIIDKSVSEQAVTPELNTAELAVSKISTEQLTAENTLAEKLANEKAAVDKALAIKLAAENAAIEQEAQKAQKDVEKLAEESAAEADAAKDKAAVQNKPADENTANNEAERVAKLDAEKQTAEQLAALPTQSTSISAVDEPEQAVAETETGFEKSRREDLLQLSELASRIRFVTNDTETTSNSKQPMDRMFELLFLYSETTVTVQVASNEYAVDDSNQLISRLRALVIINYLIDRGLDEERFKIQALGKQGLPYNNHQVTVAATVIDK